MRFHTSGRNFGFRRGFTCQHWSNLPSESWVFMSVESPAARILPFQFVEQVFQQCLRILFAGEMVWLRWWSDGRGDPARGRD